MNLNVEQTVKRGTWSLVSLSHIKETKIVTGVKQAFFLRKLRQKNVSRFVHDVRSPMSALKMLLGSAATELSLEKKALLEKSIQRIDELTMELARMANVPKPFKQRPADFQAKKKNENTVAHWARDIVLEVKEQYAKVCIHLEARPEDGDFIADISAHDFKRTLSNLLNNSLEARDEGQEVKVRILDDGRFIHTWVEDNGGGISEEYLPFIFNEGVSYGKTAGTGLGLFFAKTLIEFWGGAINLESKVGQGTKVHFTIPKVKPKTYMAL